MDPLERFVTANQIRQHLLTWEGGDKATVLCLHGFLDSAWGFEPLAPLLAERGYRVVAVDMRGHGDTDRCGPGQSYLFFDYVFDVAELVAKLAPERLFLVGHSMGSAVSALYAGSFPDRVQRLALLEGLGMHDQPLENGPAAMAAWIETVQRARLRSPTVYPNLEAAAAAILKRDALCPDDVARLLALRGTRPLPGGVAFKHDPVHFAPNPYLYQHEAIRHFWERVACPTLILRGEKSEYDPPEDMDRRLVGFRRSRRATIAGAGHMMIRHQPARVAAELLQLFEG